jgi:hypothetical protein
MSDYTIVAEDPGDIMVTFTSVATGIGHVIPLKSISAQKTTDVTPEYGTGRHTKYAQTQGKIDYKGDFEIGTWWVSNAQNPETWMDLIKNELTYSGVEGLSQEFTIVVSDTSAQYNRSQREGPSLVTGGSGIVTFNRCLLTQDSLSVGNVGSTASTKYSWSAMSRDPA